MIDAPLLVRIGVMAKSQLPARFSQPVAVNDFFFLNTSAYSFDTDVETLLSRVDAYIVTMRSKDVEIEIHYSLRLENVTAPRPGAGSWIQAKEHFDGALANGDYVDKSSLRDRLAAAHQNILTQAHY